MKINFSKLCNTIGQFITNNSTKILTGAGLIFEGAAVLSVGKAAPKALEAIKAEEKELQRKMDLKEKVSLTWKMYVPSSLYFAASATCFIGSCAIGVHQNRALTAALGMSEAANVAYKETVKEVVGEKKEAEIRDKVVRDAVEKNPPSKEVIYLTGKGDTLFYESVTGQYFRSSFDAVARAANDFRDDIRNREMYMSLNQWLVMYLGLDKEVIAGELLGWNADKPMKLNRSCLEYDNTRYSEVSPDNKEVVHLLIYDQKPFSDFDKLK